MAKAVTVSISLPWIVLALSSGLLALGIQARSRDFFATGLFLVLLCNIFYALQPHQRGKIGINSTSFEWIYCLWKKYHHCECANKIKGSLSDENDFWNVSTSTLLLENLSNPNDFKPQSKTSNSFEDLCIKANKLSGASSGKKASGALLIIRKVPEIEFLLLPSHNWCASSERKGDTSSLEAATAKILSSTGLKSEEIKILPNISKDLFLQKSKKKQVKVTYWIAEANPLAEVKVAHKWRNLEITEKENYRCKELCCLLYEFHNAASKLESQWNLQLDELDFHEDLADGSVGKWYRDKKKKGNIFRLLEKKEKIFVLKPASNFQQ